MEYPTYINESPYIGRKRENWYENWEECDKESGETMKCYILRWIYNFKLNALLLGGTRELNINKKKIWILSIPVLWCVELVLEI